MFHKDVMCGERAALMDLAGDLDGAIADCARSIEIEPKFDGAWRSHGLVKRKKGNAEGAAADLARAAKLTSAQTPR